MGGMSCRPIGAIPKVTGYTRMAALAGCLLAGRLARADSDPVRFRIAYAVGDQATIERLFTTDMTTVVSTDDVGTAVNREKVTYRYRYRQRVGATWPSGRPQQVKRIYEIATVTRIKPSAKVSKEVSPIQGTAIEVSDRDGVAQISAPTGLDPYTSRSLGQALMDDVERYALTGDRRVGETWPMPSSLSAVIVLSAKCEGTCRFEAIEMHAGRRCARVSLRLKLDGVDPDGAAVRSTQHGTAWWAIDIQRAIEITVDAETKTEFTTREGARVVHTSREGTMHLSRRIRWTELGGRKVTAP